MPAQKQYVVTAYVKRLVRRETAVRRESLSYMARMEEATSVV